MKLASVSNLEKRKNDNFNVMLTPMQGFPYWRMRESPFTSWKFVHPHSLNLYSSLPKVPTKITIFTLYPKKTSFLAHFFNFIFSFIVHFNFNFILFVYTGHTTFDFDRGSIFTCFLALKKVWMVKTLHLTGIYLSNFDVLYTAQKTQSSNWVFKLNLLKIYIYIYFKAYWHWTCMQNKLAC